MEKKRYDLTCIGDKSSPMQRSDIPSLDDLRAFEVVARLGSVRAAATELNLTHGAVSRRVSKLAGDLGLELLEAHGRGLRLTSDGEKLAQATTRALALVSSTLDEIRSATPAQPVLVSCERSLAMRWLIPRLADFQDRHSDVDLHLAVGGGAFDFSRDRVTLAIRRLDFAVDPRCLVTRLMREEVGPVMQAGMVERFRVGDYIALASKTRPDAWNKWAHANPEAPKPRSTRFMDHHFLMAEAAASGLGVAMCPRVIAADDIRNERLVAPMGFTPDGSEYGLIQSALIPEAPHALLFKTWLQAQIA
ncbi:LysR family transcriptional regulator [Ensifer sp. LC163]|uniref:LysR family transcriptional regulator n=1 Tax=Ensifer sp. LC163 TaxID=1120652 RepID=UPI001FCD2982|nr:LysR family transcriptional regulator [Ensifer sp. LC163]